MALIYSDSAEDYRPVLWLKGYPVGISILLIVLHTAAMIFFAVAKASGHGELFDFFALSTRDIWERHDFWQLFTYAFAAMPSLSFVLQMLMLYWFGPEVERFVGRSAFFKLYLGLLLLPALFLTAIGYYQPVRYAGPDNLLFGFFIAFVTIYPNVEILFLRLTVKWLAFILLGIYSLVYLSERQFLPLAMLGICTGIGYFGMRVMGVGRSFNWWEKLKEGQKRKRHYQKVKNRSATDNQATIDTILDKISKQGIRSLTQSERTALENARSALLKRDKNK